MNVPNQLRPPAVQTPAAGPAEESAPTRHLSAAAYLDEGFRQASLREAYYQARRVVAPSYGLRLAPVLWHCLRARNAATIRDATILVLLLISACLYFVPLLGVVVSLASLHLVVVLWRIGRDIVRAPSGEPVPFRALLRRGMQIAATLAVLGVGYVFWVLFALLLSSSGGDSESLAAIGWASFVMPFVVLAPPVVANLWAQSQLDRLIPGAWGGNPQSQRFSDLERQTHGNTTVYSGYHPFVGSGEVVDTWGFAQRLVRREDVLSRPQGEQEREFPHAPFTAHDIIGHVRQHLQALAEESGPERRLPGLRMEDRVFLAGTEISNLSPLTPPELVAQIVQYPITPARHYLTCRVESWRGEIVTSVYVHFAVRGRSLYLEITTTALPPCDERYRIVDQVDGTGTMAYWRAFGKAIADAPRTAALAPINVVRALADAVTSASQGAPPATVARGFDYGARFNVRELGSAEMTRNHVQTQDILKHKRIIERRVLATVLDFLEDRGVDTSEYRQRALTILNAGTVNTGSGSMYVESAIGQQNQTRPTA